MGRLDIRICEARNLPDTQIVGKPDPFCVVQCEKNVFRTRVVDNNLNPRFEEVFKLTIKDVQGAQIRFEMWNHNLVSDELLGIYTLSVGTLKRGIVRDQWFLLQKCKGNAEVRIRLCALDFGLEPTAEERAQMQQSGVQQLAGGGQSSGAGGGSGTNVPLNPMTAAPPMSRPQSLNSTLAGSGAPNGLSTVHGGGGFNNSYNGGPNSLNNTATTSNFNSSGYMNGSTNSNAGGFALSSPNASGNATVNSNNNFQPQAQYYSNPPSNYMGNQANVNSWGGSFHQQQSQQGFGFNNNGRPQSTLQQHMMPPPPPPPLQQQQGGFQPSYPSYPPSSGGGGGYSY